MVETQVSPSRYARFMFIEALTPMHPGQGRGSEIVDLTVQRDEFGIPTIWSSGLKGVMRSSLTLKCKDETCRALVNAVFGPEPGGDEASEYSSAVSFLDARLLLIPVRSLRGVWVYATSRHLLNYYRSYLDAMKPYNNNVNTQENALDKLIKIAEGVASGNALVTKDSVIYGGKAVLNELEFTAQVSKDLLDGVQGILPKDLANKVAGQGLALVSDDDMMGLIRRSLIVQPRIRLDYSTKTVARGGLWEEEYLPQYTVFVSGVICGTPKMSEERFKSKVSKAGDKADDAIKQFGELKRNAKSVCDYLGNASEKPSQDGTLNLFFGGKETLGKGLARVWWYP